MGKLAIAVTYFALFIGQGVQAANLIAKHFYVYGNTTVTDLKESPDHGATIPTVVGFITNKGAPLSLPLCTEASRETIKDLPKSLFTFHVVETVFDDQTETSCIADGYAER